MLLAEAGCVVCASMGEADAIVVNTCGFIAAAREESLQVIREAVGHKSGGRCGRVVVAGCLSNRDGRRLREIVPGIDAIIGAADREAIVRAVTGRRAYTRITKRRGDTKSGLTSEPRPEGSGPSRLDPRKKEEDAETRRRGNAEKNKKKKNMPTNSVGMAPSHKVAAASNSQFAIRNSQSDLADTGRFRLTPRHTAYLRISEGCSQGCTFCTIPSIRGPFRSKPPPQVLAEAARTGRRRRGRAQHHRPGHDQLRHGPARPAGTLAEPAPRPRQGSMACDGFA